MVSLPLLWFLLSIDFNCYVGTRLSAKSTSDATFRFFHVNNVVPALVILVRIGQHILGTESDTQSAAFAALSINYYGSFWHVCAWSGSTSKACSCSTVLPDRESATGCMISCLWRFVNVLLAAIAYVSDSHAPATWLQRPSHACDFGLGITEVKPHSVTSWDQATEVPFTQLMVSVLDHLRVAGQPVLLAFRILSSASLIATV